jgi:protocadherin Fat 1/2/3
LNNLTLVPCRTGINQKVRYEIQTDATNSSEYFHIDPEDGSVYLKRSLDHELHDSHHFTVVAIDAGVPSLSSTAHVWVTGMHYRDVPFSLSSVTLSTSLLVGTMISRKVTDENFEI